VKDTEQTPSCGANTQRRSGDIGVILVHGIGEQTRFEHLDSQLRFLIAAITRLAEKDSVTVEVDPSGPSPFHADTDTWNSGPRPSVTVVTRHRLNGKLEETRIGVHEVWWADVNEEYSLAKQLRFWRWGLSLWFHPGNGQSNLASSSRVRPPNVGRGGRRLLRARLYWICTFFALLGIASWAYALVRKYFDLKGLRPARVITNYVSGVKLYGQAERLGPGLFRGNADFLDTIGDPPRVSIRRRMVRAIADVACQGYDRWYILAHSLGTVVAFNGLMETSHAWPGYLDEARWECLKLHQLAGPAAPGTQEFNGRTMPPRPLWLNGNEIAYRGRIFSGFRGFLTYGSPLEKFAAIWPKLVPLGLERVFREDLVWINLFDPMDPVSGRLEAYARHPQECCPLPIDVGYSASWMLLLAHLKYLSPRAGELDAAQATSYWLLTNSAQPFHDALSQGKQGWFMPDGATNLFRRLVAFVSWIVAGGILAVAADLWAFLVIPPLLKISFLSEYTWMRQHEPVSIAAALCVWPLLAALAALLAGTAARVRFGAGGDGTPQAGAPPAGQGPPAAPPRAPVQFSDTFPSNEP
jgi:hypothetical protein